ncbi:MAG: UPF0280 family protein [bacterium]|nr:UPF0280 family protein [bacterium]
MRYGERFYRDFSESKRWVTSRVKMESTDLYIRTRKELTVDANSIVKRLRGEIRDHIKTQDTFLSSYQPIERMPNRTPIIEAMYAASEKSGTGPMSAVAGAIAEFVGKELPAEAEEVIVENGGDIWLALTGPIVVSIFAGDSSFAGKIGLKIDPANTPGGICTSSGKVGHSFSYGNADSVTVLSADTALADAVATETCNRVKAGTDVEEALSYAMNIEGIKGAVIIYRDIMAAQGDLELVDPGI